VRDELGSLPSLRQRLRQLGETRLAPASTAVQTPPPSQVGAAVATALERLAARLEAEVVAVRGGPVHLVARHSYPLEHRHGDHALLESLRLRPETLSLLSRQSPVSELTAEDALFFDVETTGLAGGTGTLVFLVGIGRFRDGLLEVVQLFLPGPSDELALLAAVRAELESRPAYLVTYNGRCFDAPLVQTRFLLHHQRLPLETWPHVDLLYPARSLYRARLPDCCLSTVESLVLQVRRSQEDVPGELIPGIYFDYLRTGSVEPLARVFYHNLHDILSLAVLSGVVSAAIEGAPGGHPLDCLGAGRMLEAAGRASEAGEAYRRAAAGVRGYHREEALWRLGLLHKRYGRHAEAEQVWRGLVSGGAELQALPHIELAKHLEHRRRDCREAADVVRLALALPAARHPALRAELQHRLSRLERKLAASAAAEARAGGDYAAGT